MPPKKDPLEQESQPSMTGEADRNPDLVAAETAVNRNDSDVVREQESEKKSMSGLETTETAESEIVYPTGAKLAIITIGLSLSVFLVALVCISPFACLSSSG